MFNSLIHLARLVPLLFLSASLVQASNSITPPQGFSFLVQEWNASSKNWDKIKPAQPGRFGFSFKWLKDHTLLIQAKDLPKVGSQHLPSKITVETEVPVELEGETSDDLLIVSGGIHIRNSWSSPSLNLEPTASFNYQRRHHQIFSGAELSTRALRLYGGNLLNEGRISSPESLEVGMEKDSLFQNAGVIQTEGTLRWIGRQDGVNKFISRGRFVNHGSVIAPEIVVGSLRDRFYSFENGDPSGSSQKEALINTKRLLVDTHLFLNVATIQVSEKISLVGFDLYNQKGKLHSGGLLKANFDLLHNSEGSLSGNTKTEINVWENWENQNGEVGSASPTELKFHPKAVARNLGKIQGTEITLSSAANQIFRLEKGTLIGQNSILIDSKSKVEMPGVQIQTPLLNLSVPDFALDEQKQCSQTVVHCHPSQGFTLTSPFCTDGKVAFIESCFKHKAFSSQEKAQVESPSQMLQRTWENLKNDIQKTLVYFEPEAGRVSQYNISLRAPIKASEEVEFVAPLATIYLGDRSQEKLESLPGNSTKEREEIGIEAKSLRAWANFLFVVDGFVAARDAFIHAPNGLEIGQLVAHPKDRVKVEGLGEFPFLCRNGASWITQNQTYLNGPLKCNGDMDVGELIVNSKKSQWWSSPDLNVRGNFTLREKGPIHVVRQVGEMKESQDAVISTPHYAVSGQVRIGKSLISEKPVPIKLYYSFFHADQIEGNVSFERIGTTGNRTVQFPGEKPTKVFHPTLSSSKSAALQLEGKTNEGILSVPEVFLTEHKSGLVLASRNPYYFDPKNPIQDLMKKEFPKNTVYMTENLREAFRTEAQHRFHFGLRERFFFNHSKSEQFYNQIKDDVVILHPSKGLMPLPEGPVVFSLSPELLLKRVQEAAQENLMRGYLEKGQSISLDYLVQLHRNATDYLKKIGVSFSPSQKGSAADELTLMNALTAKSKSVPLPKKPLIFYQRIKNPQGVSEFKPTFYFPQSLLEEARGEQTGNVFATLLACFPKNMTAEEMVESLTDGPEKEALVRFLNQNPHTRKMLTDKALHARLEAEKKEGADDSDEKLVLDVPIRAAHFAVVTQGDIEVGSNLHGKSAALTSQKGNITFKPQAGSTQENSTLRLEEKLGVRAEKNIETQAMNIQADSLLFEAQGDIEVGANLKGKSAALHSQNGNVRLKSQSGRTQEGVNYQDQVTDLRTLRFEGKLHVKAGKNIETQAVDIEAGSLLFEAQGDVIDAAIFLESHEERRSKDSFEQSSERKARVSRFQAQKEATFQGKNVVFEGTDLEADTLNLKVDRNEGKVSVLGVNEERSSSQTKEEKTGWFFWSGKKITHKEEYSSQHRGAKLKAKQMNLSGQEVTLQAPELETENGEIEAERVRILQGKNISHSQTSETSTNAFWVKAKSTEAEDQTFSQMKLNGKMQINAKTLELEKVEGEVLQYLDHLKFDPDKLKVVHQLLEEIHNRKEESISAPGPALIAAVAVAMSVATAGTGSAAATAMGLKAATLAGTITSAAVSTITAKMATQITLGVLSGKTPGEMLQQFTSPETLKELVTSTLTAGALHGLEEVQNAANTASCLRKVETAATQAGVGLGVNCGFGAQFDEALKGAGVQFASQAGSSFVAEQIGEHFAQKQDPLARGLHKMAHGASAAAFGAAGASVLKQDVASAAVGAASGAMVAEIVAEALYAPLKEDVAQEIRKREAKEGRELSEAEGHRIWKAKIADISQIARFAGALSGLMTGQASGVYSAQGAAQTATENNFEKTLDKNWSETWENLRERLAKPAENSSTQGIEKIDFAEKNSSTQSEDDFQNFETPRVKAARQEQLRKALEEGVARVSVNEDGSVNVSVDPDTLPHLKPNLQQVPDLNTDQPLEEDPIPEIILMGALEGAKRVGAKIVEKACFPGETPICIEGKESSSQLRPIQEIQVGDWVESFNFSTNRTECRKVEQIFQRTAQDLTVLSFGGKVLRATGNHPFYIPAIHQWVPARSLRVGDELQTLSGSLVRIDDIRVEQGNFPVFNFEVEGTHTYYAEGVLVHNCNGIVRGAAKTAIGNEVGAAARGVGESAGEVIKSAPKHILGQVKDIEAWQHIGEYLGNKKVTDINPFTGQRDANRIFSQQESGVWRSLRFGKHEMAKPAGKGMHYHLEEWTETGKVIKPDSSVNVLRTKGK